MIRLSAFADEISSELHEQIATLQSEQIHFLDLRSVWGINVLDLTDTQVAEIKQALDASSTGVAAICSPIGKVSIDTPLTAELQRLQRAIELAHYFATPFIRIFSFYPPATGIANEESATNYRNEVAQRLRQMTATAASAGITLLHENEKDIYGDSIAHCVDLLQSCNDPHFQAILDPANFIQCGQTPYPDAYNIMQPWLRYIHVKDARADGSVVAAGEGSAHWPQLLERLRQDGYDGFFTLEPHLASAGQMGGYSGPDLFHHASQSLQRLLRAMRWDYA